MITVHTSMINTHLNQDEISCRFDFIAIELISGSTESQRERIPVLLTQLYRLKDNRFLAVAKGSGQGNYVALVNKGQLIKSPDADVAIRHLQDDALPPDWIILTLLANALPTQLASNSQRQTPWFFASDLHYVLGHEAYKSGYSEVICCQVKPQFCRAGFGQHLQPSAVTFSSRNAHIYQGELTKRARSQPSFDLDSASQAIARLQGGTYLKMPIFKSNKARAPAYEVSAKAPETYRRSRLGALGTFLKDFHDAYDGVAKISLKSFEAEQIKVSKKTIHSSHDKMMDLLRQQTITLINSSDDSLAVEALYAELERRKFTVALATQPMNGLNFHIVKHSDFYKKNKLPDPYISSPTQYQQSVIQHCYDENLISDSKHTIDVLLSDLLIKLEINQGSLIADYPSLPSELIFMSAVKHPDPENKIWIWSCAQIDDRQLKLWVATQSEADTIFAGATSAQFSRLQNPYKVPYVIYDSALDKLMLVEDTNALSIPDHEALTALLMEIEQARQKTIPAILVEQFLNEHPMGLELSDTIKSLLASALDGQLAAEDVAIVHYKSKAEIAFHQHLALNGHVLNTSLRGKDGPLGNVRDIWAVAEQGLYCVGPKDSPQQVTENFSHIYHLDTAGEGFPSWFIPSLQVWHIRHRNATTLPFIFKHLREFKKMQITARGDDN